MPFPFIRQTGLSSLVDQLCLIILNNRLSLAPARAGEKDNNGKDDVDHCSLRK